METVRLDFSPPSTCRSEKGLGPETGQLFGSYGRGQRGTAKTGAPTHPHPPITSSPTPRLASRSCEISPEQRACIRELISARIWLGADVRLQSRGRIQIQLGLQKGGGRVLWDGVGACETRLLDGTEDPGNKKTKNKHHCTPHVLPVSCFIIVTRSRSYVSSTSCRVSPTVSCGTRGPALKLHLHLVVSPPQVCSVSGPERLGSGHVGLTRFQHQVTEGECQEIISRLYDSFFIEITAPGIETK